MVLPVKEFLKMHRVMGDKTRTQIIREVEVRPLREGQNVMGTKWEVS